MNPLHLKSPVTSGSSTVVTPTPVYSSGVHNNIQQRFSIPDTTTDWSYSIPIQPYNPWVQLMNDPNYQNLLNLRMPGNSTCPNSNINAHSMPPPILSSFETRYYDNVSNVLITSRYFPRYDVNWYGPPFDPNAFNCTTQVSTLTPPSSSRRLPTQSTAKKQPEPSTPSTSTTHPILRASLKRKTTGQPKSPLLMRTNLLQVKKPRLDNGRVEPMSCDSNYEQDRAQINIHDQTFGVFLDNDRTRPMEQDLALERTEADDSRLQIPCYHEIINELMAIDLDVGCQVSAPEPVPVPVPAPVSITPEEDEMLALFAGDGSSQLIPRNVPSSQE